MAPLLIDGRGLVKLGLISVLLAAAVFAGGFFSGYQQAAAFYLAGSDVQVLFLPEKTTNEEYGIELQAPKIAEAGEEIDVDQPEVLSQVVPASALVSTSVNNAEKISGQSSKQISNQTAGHGNKSDVLSLLIETPESVINKDNVTHKTKEISSAVIETDSHAPDVVQANKQDAESSRANGQLLRVIASNSFKGAELTSEELKEIKYSIQVGVYGRLINAENMMQVLRAQQFDAYITDYVNKKNEIRYNVRFGYLLDKKSATDRLNEFQSGRNDDGYLVKFSSENIVNLADAEELKVIENLDKIDHSIKPTINSSGASEKIFKGAAQGNLSQAVISQALMVTN